MLLQQRHIQRVSLSLLVVKLFMYYVKTAFYNLYFSVYLTIFTPNKKK